MHNYWSYFVFNPNKMKQKVKEQRKIFKLRKVNSIIPKLFLLYMMVGLMRR